MKEQRFSIGDKVTYKSLEECGDCYHYCGDEQGGYVGTVKEYTQYVDEKGCWVIRVSYKNEADTWGYSMLESEFREYDLSKSQKMVSEYSKIVFHPSIGDKVVRGRDWDWGNQDQGSIYGRVIETKTDWCRVEWIDERDGNVIDTDSYRCGSSGKYDLYYYNGERAKIKPSEGVTEIVGTLSISTTTGIINEMSPSMAQMEKAKLEWEQIYSKEQVSGTPLALKHSLKHQKPVLRITKTKSTKLVIK